jgi:hypothetical protein
MMQAAQVKQVAKSELSSKVYASALSPKAGQVKAQEANVRESNVIDLQKQANFKRMFEAYSDCV